MPSSESRAASTARHYAMWMFTAACPSRCTYCDIDSQKGKRALDTATIERVAHELLELRFSEVMFAGGEPLLSADLPAALRVLRGHARTAVFTGGLPGVAQRAVEVLGEGEVDRLVYSIDSGQASDNDLIRGRKGVTSDLVELATEVARRLPRIGRSVNTVVSRLNVRSLESVWDRMSPFGLDSWSLTLAGDFFEGSPTHAMIPVEDLEELYFRTIPRLARRVAAEGAELVVLPVPYPLLAAGLSPASWGDLDSSLVSSAKRELQLYSRGEYNRTFVEQCGCPLVGMDVVIGVGGEIHPCSQAPIINPRYVIGNVKEKPLAEILRSEELERFASGVPHAPCTRCWAPSNVPRELLVKLTAPPRESRANGAQS